MNVHGLSDLVICAKNELAATLTGNLPNDHPDFRINLDGTDIMSPPLARTGLVYTLSATFVADLGAIGGSDNHTVTVQWRTNTGTPLILAKGSDLNLQYEAGTNCT